MSEILLEVDSLETRFLTPEGTVKAVNKVSFSMHKGEIVGIVGETGCGKSVTVRSILRLLPPNAEVRATAVRFKGQNLVELPAREMRKIRGRDIGFVAQNPFSSLNPILKISQQFHNVIRAHGQTTKSQSKEIALRMLQAVGIAGPERVLSGYAHELSGGMAQRTVIAMALILNPALLIADEPTTGLDLTIQYEILELVKRMTRKEERAMLLVTHDLGVVAQYCDRVVVMYAGRVVEIGPVTEVMTRPTHPYTKALIDAVPKPGAKLTHLTGRIPDLINYPSGCPFEPRCRYSWEKCEQVSPELTERSVDHACSCHLPQGASNEQAG